MKFFNTFLFLLLFFSLKAQSNFERGYIIDLENTRVECLINNQDWNYNPEEIEYKLNVNGSIKKAKVNEIKEFGKEGRFKYKSVNIEIDMTSDKLNELRTKRTPNFITKTIFLKTLVEGEATLYGYKEAYVRRYFYSINGNGIEQLIYKRYINPGKRIFKNFAYKSQLMDLVSEGVISSNEINELKYNQSDLTGIFIAYNQSANSEYIDYANAIKRKSYNLSISSGISFQQLDINSNSVMRRNVSFDKKTTLSAGLDFEYFLPFDNGRTSLLVNPSYLYYKSSGLNGHEEPKDIDFEMITIRFGARKYFELYDAISLFADGAFSLAFPLADVIVDVPPEGIVLKPREGFVFSLGIEMNKKIGGSVKYNTSRPLFENLDITTDNDFISLEVYYKIL